MITARVLGSREIGIDCGLEGHLTSCENGVSMMKFNTPTNCRMGVVAIFFKLSMAVRDLHNKLVEEKVRWFLW